MLSSALIIGLAAGLGFASLLLACILFVLCRRRHARRYVGAKPASTLAKKDFCRAPTRSLGQFGQIPAMLSVVDLEKGWTSPPQDTLNFSRVTPPQSSLVVQHWLPSLLPAYDTKSNSTNNSTDLTSKSLVAATSLPTVKTNFSHVTGAIPAAFEISPVTPILLSPNPRAASFNSKVSSTISSLRSGAAVSFPNSYPPRDMLVSSTFTPTRDDEMLIVVGETLKVLEQFEDHWSLVQRGGASANTEVGVIPTHCLVGISYAV